MDINNIISLSIAFLSLIISYLALYFSIFKRCKEKVYVFYDFDDISLSIATAVEKIPTSFQIGIPIIIKNVGANPLVIKTINWNIETPEFLKSRITFEPQIDNSEGFTVLRPYDQTIGVLGIEFWIERNSEADFGTWLRHIQNNIDDYNYSAMFSYRIYKKEKIEIKHIKVDLKNTIKRIMVIAE